MKRQKKAGEEQMQLQLAKEFVDKVTLRGLNFRLGKEFYKELDKKMRLERHPQSSSKPESSTPLLSVEPVSYTHLDVYKRQL